MIYLSQSSLKRLLRNTVWVDFTIKVLYMCCCRADRSNEGNSLFRKRLLNNLGYERVANLLDIPFYFWEERESARIFWCFIAYKFKLLKNKIFLNYYSVVQSTDGIVVMISWSCVDFTFSKTWKRNGKQYFILPPPTGRLIPNSLGFHFSFQVFWNPN